MSERIWEPLAMPASTTCADQAREMGLTVGDIIWGREQYREHWNVARLTLLWIGKTVCVWDVESNNSTRNSWEHKGESGNWTLDCRKWILIGRKEKE